MILATIIYAILVGWLIYEIKHAPRRDDWD